MSQSKTEEEEDGAQWLLNEDFLSYELEYLTLYGFRPTLQDFENDRAVDRNTMSNDINHHHSEGKKGKNNFIKSSSSSAAGGNTLGGFDLEDDLLIY